MQGQPSPYVEKQRRFDIKNNSVEICKIFFFYEERRNIILIWIIFIQLNMLLSYFTSKASKNLDLKGKEKQIRYKNGFIII